MLFLCPSLVFIIKADPAWGMRSTFHQVCWKPMKNDSPNEMHSQWDPVTAGCGYARFACFRRDGINWTWASVSLPGLSVRLHTKIKASPESLVCKGKNVLKKNVESRWRLYHSILVRINEHVCITDSAFAALSSFWPRANIISTTGNPKVYKYPSDFSPNFRWGLKNSSCSLQSTGVRIKNRNWDFIRLVSSPHSSEPCAQA